MKMIKRIVAFVLACVLLALCLASCASKGKPLLTLDDSEISVNLFELYLSRMKGMFCTAANFGSSATKADFWDTWLDVTNRTTYNSYYTEVVLEAAKGYLAALALFEEKELTLPDSYIDEIDREMEELVNSEADGSKTAFNAIIGEYGVNYDMLREAYIIEAKIAYLQQELFGKNGSKVGANIVDQYYKDNYARFKQVFFYTYEYVYETDENDDVIYYSSSGSIAYDRENGTPKIDEEGNYVTDKKGDRVFVYIDDKGEERIAYDRDKGVRQAKTDANGESLIRHYNDTEMEIIREQAKDVVSQVKNAEDDSKVHTFDKLVDEMSEDSGKSEYPDGYYLTADTNYAATEVQKALFEMEIGEVRMIESDYGYHVIMRYELEESAYTKDAYKNLFISNSTGTYMFMEDLISELLTEYLKPYKERVSVDEDLLSTVDIKRAAVNFYY